MTTYQTTLEHITPQMLEGFFVGWPHPPSPETHLKILAGSSHFVLALEGERVIGFITSISDGVLSAYIPLLEVLPEFKRQGIGWELVQRMKTQLEALYMIDLLCDDDVQAFYQKLGFQSARGVMIRNYSHQSGV